MSMNKKIEENFKKYINMLIKELIEMYPEIKDFKTVKAKLTSVFLVSPGLVVRTFKTQVEQYKTQIESKDEDFFLQLDLKGTPLEAFCHLKTIYTTSSEDTKNMLWKYITLLSKLALKYTK